MERTVGSFSSCGHTSCGGPEPKILFLESSPNWGGQEERLVREAAWLQGAGHEILIACGADTACGRRASEAGIPVRDIPFRANYDLAGIAALFGLVRREEPDIIHARSSKDAWFALWLYRAGFPVVRSRHVTLPGDMPLGRKLIYRHGCSRLVASAAFIAAEMRDSLAIPAHRIEVIGEGVDTAEFSPGDGSLVRSEFGIGPGEPLFGVVAMLRPGKGHRFFLAAARRVLVRCPTARFLIVGGAAGVRSDFETDLRRMIDEQFGGFARPPVVMTGFRKDIPAIMRALDCLVVPSSKEAQTLVIPQAFATGKPAIGSRVGGIPELLTDGVNGFLVEPRNADQLADSMVHLAHNPGLRRRFGIRAREFAQSELVFAKKMQQLLGCYRQAISAVPRRRKRTEIR